MMAKVELTQIWESETHCIEVGVSSATSVQLLLFAKPHGEAIDAMNVNFHIRDSSEDIRQVLLKAKQELISAIERKQDVENINQFREKVIGWLRT
jgi:hypothetical protein